MFRRTVCIQAKLFLLLVALLLLSNPTSAQIDNCCNVDRQCQTDDEWVNGYYAHQNNQCGAPSQTVQLATASQTQPQTETSEGSDNCCLSGWHCNADEEWTSGYFAFQNDHCASQAHWEKQWRKRQNGNQQAKEGKPRSPAHEQNSDDPPAANRNSASLGKEPGTFRAAIDVGNPQDTEHQLEDGRRIGIQQITRERMCGLFPFLDWCEKLFGR